MFERSYRISGHHPLRLHKNLLLHPFGAGTWVYSSRGEIVIALIIEISVFVFVRLLTRPLTFLFQGLWSQAHWLGVHSHREGVHAQWRDLWLCQRWRYGHLMEAVEFLVSVSWVGLYYYSTFRLNDFWPDLDLGKNCWTVIWTASPKLFPLGKEGEVISDGMATKYKELPEIKRESRLLRR
jgi:hypothetical protein